MRLDCQWTYLIIISSFKRFYESHRMNAYVKDKNQFNLEKIAHVITKYWNRTLKIQLQTLNFVLFGGFFRKIVSNKRHNNPIQPNPMNSNSKQIIYLFNKTICNSIYYLQTDLWNESHILMKYWGLVPKMLFIFAEHIYIGYLCAKVYVRNFSIHNLSMLFTPWLLIHLSHTLHTRTYCNLINTFLVSLE